MNYLLTSALFGFFGGFVRGIVGIIKDYRKNKKFKFEPYYFLITLLGSALIGVFTALILSEDYRISLISGYAGIDLIEGLTKAYLKK